MKLKINLLEQIAENESRPDWALASQISSTFKVEVPFNDLMRQSSELDLRRD